MKLRKLFLAVLAGAALLTACDKKEVDLGPAKLTVNPTDVAFEQDMDSKDISLVATRDWAVTGLPDWIALSKEAGSANPDAQKVVISVTQNEGYNRSATLTFSIGFARSVLHVSQAGPDGEVDNGDGSKTNPYNVEGVIAFVTALGDKESENNVYVKGKISAISEEFSTQYGNGAFTISDDGTTESPQFTAYRVLYLGNKKFASGDTQIQVGDDVILYGKVVNYKGNTPETAQGSAFLFSLNGVDKGGDGGSTGDAKGTGTLEDPYNPAGAAAAVASLTWTDKDNYEKTEPVYIKGKISKVTTSFEASGSYGNASFTIVDETDGTGSFEVFQTYYLGNRQWKTGDTEIKENDVVIVYGPIMNYKGNTPETVGKGASYIYSLNGTTDGGGQGGGTGTPSGTGVKDDPYNVAAAVAAVKDLTWTSNTDFQKVGPFYVKGKVSSVKFAFDAEHGTATFNISDDGTTTAAQFACYSVKYFDGAAWVEGNTQVTVGADVVIYGELQNYKGNTPETVTGSYVVSISGGSDVPPVSHDGLTPETAFTASEANAWIMANLEDKASTETKYYVKGKIQRFYQKDNADQNFTNNSFHQASFFITDDGAENKEKEFEAYQIDYLNDATFDPAKDTDVKVGDEVVIYGAFKRWGTTAETTDKGSAYLYSLNAGGQGGGGGTEELGVMDSNVTFVKGTNCYDNSTINATYDGKKYSNVANLKFGTGKAYGDGTITLPAGTTTLNFFAIGWKGADATLQFTIGSNVKTVNVAGNDGASGSGPYEVTVTNSDHFTITLDAALAAETVAKVETFAGEKTGYRAFIFGVQASGNGGGQGGGGGEGGDTPVKPVNEGTLESPYTVADALIAAKDADLAGKEYYVKAVVGKDVSIKNGVASFELMDGTTDGKLTVVKAKSFKGADFTGSEPLDWLDEVVLKGKVTEYSTIPALTEGQIVKWNGKPTFLDPETDLSKVIALADKADAYFDAVVAAVTTKSIVVTDGTNNVYVFSPATMPVVGDKVRILGQKEIRNGMGQITSGAELTVLESGKTVTPGEAKDITATFDAYPASTTKNEYITFTGTLTVSGNYYNVAVEDAATYTGSIAYPVETLGLAALSGKKVVFTGYYVGTSGSKTKYLNVVCTKAEEFTQGGGGGEEQPTYASSVEWTLGTNASGDSATVNGVAGVSVIKLGTSSKAGTATLTIPAGKTKLTFYAVSWKEKKSKLVFKNGDVEVKSVEPAANNGLSGNSPYTLTVTDSDKYEVTLPSGATSLTVETSGSNKRAALFAIVAE
jgi:hypothetical protein